MTQDNFTPPGMGWIEDPAAVAAVMADMMGRGDDPVFASAARVLLAEADDDVPVFLWDAEAKILGKIIGSWDQDGVGTCVSFGWGRGAQDLMLNEIALFGDEEWPGHEIATEPIYALSRVEIGGGRIGGDGSVGAWAAKAATDFGMLLKKKYGNHDLSEYSPSRARDWGRKGLPDELEPEAKLHPIRKVAMVTSAQEAWVALGNRYPIPVCSNRGFTSTLKEGFCEPSGSWAHCMQFRGRFKSPKRGRCYIIQNSWGGYLKGDPWIEVENLPEETYQLLKSVGYADEQRRVKLPEGCFATTESVVDSMLRQKDSFTCADFKGWEARNKVLRWKV